MTVMSTSQASLNSEAAGVVCKMSMIQVRHINLLCKRLTKLTFKKKVQLGTFTTFEAPVVAQILKFHSATYYSFIALISNIYRCITVMSIFNLLFLETHLKITNNKSAICAAFLNKFIRV